MKLRLMLYRDSLMKRKYYTQKIKILHCKLHTYFPCYVYTSSSSKGTLEVLFEP